MKEKDILFGFSFYSLFSVWKIVGMTMTCDKHAVMTIMWYKTEMEQNSDRETRGDGGGGGGGGALKERESSELCNMNSREKQRKKKKKKPLVLDPTMEKVEGFQFQTSQGMNGKTGIPRKKTISQMQTIWH